MKYKFLSVFLCCLFAVDVLAQEEGCTDIFARNYNSRATLDDGSCCYFKQTINPDFTCGLPEEVCETSGLFFHNGKVWTHNDSGGKPILYALDTSGFDVVQRITLSNAGNCDWEDVCSDGVRVFVGDFGNNRGNRHDLKIYYFFLSQIPDKGDAVILVDTICFTFADQSDYSQRYYHDFDCEAMFVTQKYLYLFSKGWKTEATRLYRVPKEKGEFIVDSVSGFNSKGLITGADYDAKNNVLALVGYKNKVWTPFLYLIYDFDEENLSAHGQRINLPQFVTTQMEGICFYDDFRFFVSAETSPSYKARIFDFDCRKMFYRNHENPRHGNFVKSIERKEEKVVLALDGSAIRNGNYRLIISEPDGAVLLEKNIRIMKHDDFSVVFESKGIPATISLFGKHGFYEANLLETEKE